jgi:hypothetical protein
MMKLVNVTTIKAHVFRPKIITVIKNAGLMSEI